MIRTLKAAALIAPVAIAVSTTVRAAATAPNAWVSGKGVDQAGCGPAATPFRTFQYAHDNVVGVGGQIRVQDSAGYSPIIISKEISIINEGSNAGISATGGIAITIQAGAGDAVFLKGLSLDGQRTGVAGIKILSAAKVTVANCTITGISSGGAGIDITPAAGKVSFTVSDSMISGNIGKGISIIPSLGFLVGGSTASVRGSVSRTELNNNSKDGLLLNSGYTSGTISLYASEVNASFNDAYGLIAVGANASLHLKRSMATGNKFYGVGNNGAAVFTYGDNALDGNDIGDAFGGMSTADHLQ
ncbi:right-handed parallel beta-helix repeat-containing protein [Methylocystis parvus]|uniref:right-handed parallel beta-helix repeat-containing protein n=1 Tax=Methylocystis parvus TaxID=134 RepID=UPI003C7743DC